MSKVEGYSIFVVVLAIRSNWRLIYRTAPRETDKSRQTATSVSHICPSISVPREACYNCYFSQMFMDAYITIT